MITRRPTVDPRPVSRSVFDVRYAKRQGKLPALAFIAGLLSAFAVVALLAAHAR